MNAYRLVACSFHDELEAWATLRQTCQIIYRDVEGTEQTVTSKIIDVYTADRAEFIKLQDGTVIRLDHLIAVNDQPIQFASSPFSSS